MEIAVEYIEDSVKDINYCYDAYTVYVEDQRILTITTHCDFTTTKWLKDVQKSHRNKNGTLVVGVCVDRERVYFEKGGLKDSPYDLIQLCVGSHSLLYFLPEPYCFVTPKCLGDFFADPRVVTVGMGIEGVAKKLEKDHGFKIAKRLDLRTLAIKGLGRDDLDLGRYDLDRLAKVVLGKHMDVIRPSKTVRWYDTSIYYPYFDDRPLHCEKVKYATVDPYLCFLIGSQLLDMIDASSSSSSSSSSSWKKKKKK